MFLVVVNKLNMMQLKCIHLGELQMLKLVFVHLQNHMSNC